MNRRKQSEQLTPSEIKKLHAAHDRAIKIGLPLNVFATVNSVDKHGIDSLQTQKTFRTFKNHLWQFGYRFDFPMAYVWVAEAGEPSGYNPHLHFLLHMPPAYYETFHRLASKWLPGERTIDVREVTDMHGLLHDYLIKQSEEGRGETGIFVGKRVGTSRVLSPNSKPPMVYDIKRQSLSVAAHIQPQQISVF